MKKLFLFLCLVVLSCGYLSATNTITLHFDSKLKCQLKDWDDYNDLPPGVPPTKPKTSRLFKFNSQYYAQIELYDHYGILIHQNTIIIHPNSCISIPINTWNVGIYTLHVKLSNGSTFEFTINCN